MAVVLVAAVAQEMVDLLFIFLIAVDVAFGFLELPLAGGADGDEVRAFRASASSGLFSETTPAPQQAALFISTKSIPRVSAASFVETISSRVAPCATQPVNKANFIA